MNNDEHKLEEFDKSEEVETGYLKKWLFGFIDGILVIGLFFGMTRYFPHGAISEAIRAVHPTLFVFGLLFLYRFLTIVPFNGTPGMLLLKIKFLTGRQNPPTIGERMLASFLILANGIKYYDKR